MSNVLDIIKKENKICYFLGDYNLDLFNAEKHIKTGEFVDLMFSHHFIPLINKPTRVREKSATLIDNIFTNNVMSSTQGILFTDISDHFPIFYGCSSLCIDSSPQYIVKSPIQGTRKCLVHQTFFAVSG